MRIRFLEIGDYIFLCDIMRHEEARARAAQWTLNKHNTNKNSRLSKYQVRNITKAAMASKGTGAKAAGKSKEVSTKDVKRLIAIADEAKAILKKYT